MSKQYYTLLTDKGASILAGTFESETRLQVSKLALGDGGGTIPQPVSSQTSLINEVRRADLNTISIDKTDKNRIHVQQVIEPEVGGFYIRELGLYDVNGDLIAVGNCPPTYKPRLAEGSGRTLVINMVIFVGEHGDIELVVDAGAVYMTKQAVDTAIEDAIGIHEKSTNHPYATTKSQGFVTLSETINTDTKLDDYVPNMALFKKLYAIAVNANNAATNALGAIADLQDEMFPINEVGNVTDYDVLGKFTKTGWFISDVEDTSTVTDFPKYRDGKTLSGSGLLLVQNYKLKDQWGQFYYGIDGGFAYRILNEDMDANSYKVPWIISYNSSYPPTTEEINAVAQGEYGIGIKGTKQLETLDQIINGFFNIKATNFGATDSPSTDLVGFSAAKSKDGGFLQIVGSNNSSVPKLYARTGDSKSKVSKTVRIYHTGDKPTPAEIDAVAIGQYGLFLNSPRRERDVVNMAYLTNMKAGERRFVSNESDAGILPSTSPGYLMKIGSRDTGGGGFFMFTLYHDPSYTWLGTYLDGGGSSVNWVKILSSKDTTLPPGIPLPYPSIIPPTGFIACNGQALSLTAQPKLYALYGSNIVDMRAEWIRGLDYNRGIDPNRTILSWQQDAMRNWEATFRSFDRGSANNLSGIASLNSRWSASVASGSGDNWGSVIKIAPSNNQPTADEFRVRNRAFLYIVKSE